MPLTPPGRDLVSSSRKRLTGRGNRATATDRATHERVTSGELGGPRRIDNVERLEPRVLLSTYYVSLAGSDGSAGTSLSAPFRTIQRAANVAEPGDTVLIRAGTYRETVRPARSGNSFERISFKNYNGERVVVSGADVVSNWSHHDDAVYRATQPWTMGDGRDQVFVDGRMMIEARWPNTTLDVSRPVKATADSLWANVDGPDSTARLSDGALTHPAGTWTGATIHITSGQGWVGQTGRVTDHDYGAISYAYEQRVYADSEKYETPTGGDPYYLTGKFVALDAPAEWFRDDGGSLYLWMPDSGSPSGHLVEAKRRSHAFDLSGRSFIDVDGIDLFAATVRTDGWSNFLRL